MTLTVTNPDDPSQPTAAAIARSVANVTAHPPAGRSVLSRLDASFGLVRCARLLETPVWQRQYAPLEGEDLGGRRLPALEDFLFSTPRKGHRGHTAMQLALMGCRDAH